ncbi:MAG: hypothetical protein HYX47_02000 [Burkholderiales bacterium]|nr:hypothetical protein [Burkholderiales bacterium]
MRNKIDPVRLSALLADHALGPARGIRLLDDGKTAHVSLASGNEPLFVKGSRHSAAIVTRQMEAVREISRCSPELALPTSFGHLDDRDTVFELWEWIESPVGHSQFEAFDIRACFSSFAATASSLGWDFFAPLTNWTFKAYDDLARASIRRGLLNDRTQPEPLRRLWKLAEEIATSEVLRSQLRDLPMTFIHTDIRRENLVGRRLVDFSNSRFDMRLVEFSRFLLLNSEFDEALSQLALDPTPLCDSKIALTLNEQSCFAYVLAIDLTNLLTWAHCQVELESQSAHDFYVRGLEQAALVSDLVDRRLSEQAHHSGPFRHERQP